MSIRQSFTKSIFIFFNIVMNIFPFILIYVICNIYHYYILVRAFALHAECLVFESQPRQTLVIVTDSNSLTAKRSATGAIDTVLDDIHYK